MRKIRSLDIQRSGDPELPRKSLSLEFTSDAEVTNQTDKQTRPCEEVMLSEGFGQFPHDDVTFV